MIVVYTISGNKLFPRALVIILSTNQVIGLVVIFKLSPNTFVSNDTKDYPECREKNLRL